MPRIDLLEVSDAHRRAFELGRGQLASLLSLSLPTGWPVYPACLRGTSIHGWPFYFFIDRRQLAVIGSGGYLCAPDKNNEVQIGYEIAPGFRNRGLATAALLKVLITPVVAERVAFTPSDTDASASVLRKLGFNPTGRHEVPDIGTLWRWVLDDPWWSKHPS